MGRKTVPSLSIKAADKNEFVGKCLMSKSLPLSLSHSRFCERSHVFSIIYRYEGGGGQQWMVSDWELACGTERLLAITKREDSFLSGGGATSQPS
jgi:hypothetical protein